MLHFPVNLSRSGAVWKALKTSHFQGKQSASQSCLGSSYFLDSLLPPTPSYQHPRHCPNSQTTVRRDFSDHVGNVDSITPDLGLASLCLKQRLLDTMLLRCSKCSAKRTARGGPHQENHAWLRVPKLNSNRWGRKLQLCGARTISPSVNPVSLCSPHTGHGSLMWETRQ